jgi:hypothetical protein
MEEYEYRFKNRDAILPWIDSRDIIWTCIEVEERNVSKGDYAGCRMLNLKLSCEVADNDGGGVVHIYKSLIFHKKLDWVIDNFLKSGNYQIKINQGFPPNSELIGLRGWCHVVKEQKTMKDGVTPIQGQFRNQVSTFYTNKPKLPRDTSVIPEPAEENPFLQDEKGMGNDAPPF